MRKNFVAGNWKMNTTSADAEALIQGLKDAVAGVSGLDIAVCPPFPYLSQIAGWVQGSQISVGAQNMYFESKGAFTGEIAPEMLLDVGCQYVILGHSERRHVFMEKDDGINKKVKKAIQVGLNPILCVGELLEEREAGQTESVVETQIKGGLSGVTDEEMDLVTIAYEPVWAIGTGKTATPEQAQEVHRFIRARISEIYNNEVAEQLCIQYGGSVKPENAKALMDQSDIDGALVGGASLKADSFAAIIRAAQ